MKRWQKNLTIIVFLLAMTMGLSAAVQAAVTIRPKQTAATPNSITISNYAVSGARFYRIYFDKKAAGDLSTNSPNITTPLTSYTFSGLAADTIYHYYIEAFDANSTVIGSMNNVTYPATVTPGSVTNCDADYWNGSNSGHFKIASNQYPNTMDGIDWEIWDRTGKKKVASGRSLSSVFTVKVSRKQTYILKVRGYVSMSVSYATGDQGRFYGPWYSKVIVPSPILKKPTQANNYSAVKVRWTKVNGATKYIVYGSTSPGSGYKKIASVSKKKSSYVVKKFRGKSFKFYKTYYFKVVAVKGNAKSADAEYGSIYFLRKYVRY